jgi:exosortase/archaeosortase family protein
LIFAFCYLTTLAVIGLSAPGGYYYSFVAENLDYVNGIKRSIIAAVGWLLGIFGFETKTEPRFLIRILNKKGVIIAMDCVGYGVYSFWIAYIAANTGRLLKKIIWIIGGLLLLWLINVFRISLFLITINKNQRMPLGIDHHTWFNIAAYLAIFIMMYFFERSLRDKMGMSKK